MAAITKIEFWKDVGFIDGAVEIPSLAAPDPVSPDITIEPEDPIIPSRDRFFSEFKLKEYYSELLTVSYMRITYQIKNTLGVNVPKVFYGWVKDVTLTSDGDLPLTTISWHIDEWRTWKADVTFGSGHVKRRPFVDIDTTPIQNYPYNYLKLDDTDIYIKDICPRYIRYSGNPPRQDAFLWWIIFAFNYTDPNNDKTSIRKGAIPVWVDFELTSLNLINNNSQLKFKIGNNEAFGLSISEVLAGGLDEFLGISPNTIIGVWLSPYLFPPSVMSGDGDIQDPLIISGNYSASVVLQSPYPRGYIDISNFMCYPSKIDFNEVNPDHLPIIHNGSLQSTETERYIVTDFDGSKALDLPYGMTFTSWEVNMIIEADTAAIAVSFKDGFEGRTEGTVVTFPLPALPVNTNAMSEYVYSGQRDYDRESRTIESNASAWKSSATGAGSGAMMGAFGPAGLAIGAAGGAAGGLISYGVEMLYQNDEEQRITDRLKARQSASLLLGSNAITALIRGRGPQLKRLTPDAYSLTQIANTRAQFGVSVDELMSSTDSLIRTSSPTGYYNIQNLIVSGDIPVSAKRWIRNKFASGVRLI